MDRYLSTKSAAELVDAKPSTIRGAIERGELRWINIGHPKRARVRILESDLRAWMESKAVARRSRAS